MMFTKRAREMGEKAESLEAELKKEMSEIYLALKNPDLPCAKREELYQKLSQIETALEEKITKVRNGQK